MAYGLYTASYGSYNAGRKASITEVATGLPALILSSSLGGVVNNLGLTELLGPHHTGKTSLSPRYS